MMHLNAGQIRAFLDGEGQEEERRRIARHLDDCPGCRELADEFRARSGFVATKMAPLEPQPSEMPIPVQAARTRFHVEFIEKEPSSMIEKMFSRSYRPAWVLAGVIAVLAIAFLFPPVRAAANSFLGLFRVQQITLVQVDSGDIQDRLSASRQLEAIMADQAEVEEVGEYQEVADANQASQLAGIPVRLPAELGDPGRLEIQPGGKMRMAVDLPRIQAVLEEIGRSDIQLPPEIDGANVGVEIPVAVQASYGDCIHPLDEFDTDTQVQLPQDCTTLIQAASPTIDAPPGLDVSQLGQAFLEVMGMPADKAAEFSQSVDWSNTLVIPVPRYMGSFEDVQVDGVPGTFVWDAYRGGKPGYMLLWVKDGVVYALSGGGDRSEALRIANSLR